MSDLICPICGQRHITPEDKQRGERFGWFNAAVLAEIVQKAKHAIYDEQMKAIPPEYVI